MTPQTNSIALPASLAIIPIRNVTSAAKVSGVGRGSNGKLAHENGTLERSDGGRFSTRHAPRSSRSSRRCSNNRDQFSFRRNSPKRARISSQNNAPAKSLSTVLRCGNGSPHTRCDSGTTRVPTTRAGVARGAGCARHAYTCSMMT